MSSLGGILNSARNAIHAHQLSVQVAAHNIANAGTEGYSRQRAELVVGQPLYRLEGGVGSGVVVRDVARVRDSLADVAVRRESGRLADSTLRHEILSRVEGLFGEPAELGIAATLDRFWNAWSDLSTQPSSTAAKTTVRQRGEQVAHSLNDAGARLAEMESSLRSRVTFTVNEVNRIARELAGLNVEVVRYEANGTTASDLRDQRDRLIDQLAGFGSVRVVERDTGSLAVMMDGRSLVDIAAASEASVAFSNGKLTVLIGGDPVARVERGSALQEMTRLYNEDLPAVRTDLDALARGLVREVNTLHRTGWTETGQTTGTKPPGWNAATDPSYINFFAEPTSLNDVTAQNIALSAEVLADTGVIAVGTTVGGTGDNRLAIALSHLRDQSNTMSAPDGPTSFDGYYRGMVTRVAQEVVSAENSVAVHEALSTQALTRRESVSGVATDEELIKLTQFQQAYIAATRLVSAVDEMTQSLLNMV